MSTTLQVRERRRRRKDARPAEIIDAALVEFAQRGFAAARLEDVAARAGVSKATIYVYFKDKKALFEGCMRAKVSPVVADAEKLIDAFPGTTESMMRILIPMIYKNLMQSEVRELLRIVVSESGNFPFLAELHHRESVSKGKAIMEKIVARGIARGEFRAGAYAELPMVIAGPAVMSMLWTILFQRFDPIDLESAAKAHVDLILNGILNPVSAKT